MNSEEGCEATPKYRSVRLFGRIMSVVAVLCAFSIVCDSADKPDLERFAKCMASKKATMYGSFLCPHCEDQKRMFGSSFKHVPYVECSIPGSRQTNFSCTVEMIRYTPTWIFANHERLVGVQSLKTLSEKAGCPLR